MLNSRTSQRAWHKILFAPTRPPDQRSLTCVERPHLGREGRRNLPLDAGTNRGLIRAVAQAWQYLYVVWHVLMRELYVVSDAVDWFITVRIEPVF
jgi:hypothetical protein